MTTKFVSLSNGSKMPIVGFGTGSLRDDEKLLETVINKAIELGYRHFDTAHAYQNEAFLGKVFKKWFSSGKLKREDVFITTKLPVEALHEDKVEEYMKMSLENLQLDYVDLYLIHGPIRVKKVDGDMEKMVPLDTDHIAVWKKMEDQVDAGRTKAIGLSNFNIRQIERIIKSARIKPSCLQVEIHIDLQQRDLVNFCHQNNIVVVAYSPLGAPGRKTLQPRKLGHKLEDPTIKKIADKYKKTTSQVLLRYLIEKDIVVIPHSKNSERLKQNIEVFDFSLDTDDLKQLDNLEVGEDARISHFGFIPRIMEHPEYPFPIRIN